MKDNFTVIYSQKVCDVTHTTVVLGATSILPNMNGISIQCQNYMYGLQIEGYEMQKTGVELHIEYSTDEDIQRYFQYLKDEPLRYTVRDGRED